jgi:hypothetical protein
MKMEMWLRAVANQSQAVIGNVASLARSLALLLPVLLASCRSTEPNDLRPPTQERNLGRIEKETHLDLPDGSKVVQFFEADRVVDPIWVAKITIPESSSEMFREAVARRKDDSAPHGGLAKPTVWWKPQNVVLTKYYLADSQTLVSIVIAKEGDGTSVYVECAVF